MYHSRITDQTKILNKLGIDISLKYRYNVTDISVIL
jgi:hypothetical protein